MATKSKARKPAGKRQSRRVQKNWVARMKCRAQGVASAVSGGIGTAGVALIHGANASGKAVVYVTNAIADQVEKWEERMYERRVTRDAIKAKKQFEHAVRVGERMRELP